MDAALYYRQPAAIECVPVTHDEIMQRREELGTEWLNVEVPGTCRLNMSQSHGHVYLNKELSQVKAERRILAAQSAMKACGAEKHCQ